MIGFQSLLQRTANVCLLFAILITSMRSAIAVPPKPDFPTLLAYERALESSSDPSTKAIVKQIMRGPIDLARERAAAQAAGISLTPPHLRPVLVSQNAAPIYLQWEKNRLSLPDYAEPLGGRYAYTPQQLAQVQQILSTHPAEMHLLHEAADRPFLVITPHQHVFHIGETSISNSTFREAARELTTESFLLAKNGHYAAAILNQSRVFRVTHQATYSNEIGPVIAYLSAAAIQDLALSGMRDILFIAGPNANVDMQVQNAINSNRPLPSLELALSGEMLHSLSEMETIRRLSPMEVLEALQESMEPKAKYVQSSDKSSTPQERHFINALFDAAEAEYLHGMRLWVQASEKPEPIRHRMFVSIPTAGVHINPIRAISALYMGIPLDGAEDRIEAEEEVTLAGAALLAVRAHTGRFPKSLSSGFIDPYNGKPLGYRQEGKGGFVVYSVAPHGKFDGGKPNDKRHGGHVFFRYPAPPPIPLPRNS